MPCEGFLDSYSLKVAACQQLKDEDQGDDDGDEDDDLLEAEHSDDKEDSNDQDGDDAALLVSMGLRPIVLPEGYRDSDSDYQNSSSGVGDDAADAQAMMSARR